MTLAECHQKKTQIDSIESITVSDVGFVCMGGFVFENTEEYELIDGETLYSEQLNFILGGQYVFGSVHKGTWNNS